MAPDVNWDLISSIAKGSVRFDNDESTEEEIDMLRNVDENDFKDDSEKLILLIQSLKKAFDFRELALNDIFQDHEVEIDELKRELDEERKLGGGVPRDAEFYRIENRRLMEQKDAYMQQNEELNRDFIKASDERNKFEQELESSRKLVRELRAETQDLRSNLRDYQSIIDKQNIQRVSSGGDSQLQEKLNERNKQISDLLTQITDLEKVNRELEESARKLRQEMETGQEDMEKMADEYEKMRKIIGSTDKFSDDLQKQNAQLKLQVADLREDLSSRKDEDDVITTAVNDKVDEWTKRIQERDQENDELKRTVAQLRAKIASAGWDQDKLNVEKLTKKVEESRNEVSKLKAALAQSVGDMEEQTAIVEDLRRDQGTNREVLNYKRQIQSLQDQITEIESSSKMAESRRAAAEADAQENDIKLTEALRRVHLLESGQYGLTEAVNEIKECKDVIRTRDREIRELTQVTNKLEEKLNDFIEENEEFRERLGINPRNLDDIVELRKKRALRQQQFRAENQILLKEIESLEEERIELKKQIRRQAQSQIQKAADEGLNEEDMNLIEEFVDEVIHMRRTTTHDKNQKLVVRGSLAAVFRSERAATKSDDTPDVRRLEHLLDDARSENRKLIKDLDNAKSENEVYKTAIRDIAKELQGPNEQQRASIRIPSLNKLVDLIEGKQSHKHGGGTDQSEFDELRGRNDELRNELKRVRGEQVKLSSDKSNLQNQMEMLKADLATRGKRVNLNRLSLPYDVVPESDDVINALNEQLIEVLNDREKKTNKLNEMKEVLENSRRQLQVVRHQTHILYKEHHEFVEEKDEERKKWDKEKEQVEEKLDVAQVKVDEYERLLSTLESNPDEAKRRIAETSRKVSLLRVNEKTLVRRYKALEAAEDLLVTENQRLKREIGLMEKTVSEKISYLERYKAMAIFKIESLQKSVENSVPEDELARLNRRFDELTVKYRDLLQQENQHVATSVKLETLKEELKISVDSCEVLRGELSIEKERRITLEGAMKRTNTTLIPSDSDSILKKVTVLEMKELNERQKADHATRMYKRVKEAMEEVQRRNSELESKFAQLTQLNLAAQQTERELRDELANAVPRQVSEADRKKINSLEEELAKAKVKISKLQDMSDISYHQLRSVQSQQQAREREMKSLRQQVREFQVQSDSNALIGTLHHQILNLQASEVDARRKLSVAEKKVAKLESCVLKTEKQVDEKNESIYLVRIESNSRVKQLRKTIQSLRHQFSGALPLAQQEKFSLSMLKLHQNRIKIQDELRNVRIEREKLEDELGEAEIKQAGLQELKNAIENNRGADKLTEWSNKMDKLRLQDMKLQRQVTRQNEEIKYLEKLNSDHETNIANMEEDIVQLLKAQEEHQVEWEVREMELERLLDQFQARRIDVSKKAKRLEDVTNVLPDPSLPVDEQLEDALKKINEHNKVVSDLQGHNKALRFENGKLKEKRHTLESEIVSRDSVISELRLNMPSVTSLPHLQDNTSDQQLRVAMETIQTLKKRLQAKEDAIGRHKKLLDDVRKDQELSAGNHEKELVILQKQFSQRTERAIMGLKTSPSAPPRYKTSAHGQETLAHVMELEDLVKEQDVAMAALMDRVRAANADVTKQKQSISLLRKQSEVERNKLIDEHESNLNSVRIKLTKKHHNCEALKKELALAKEELEQEKEKNVKTPLSTMNNLVARLKQQLQVKEIQQQKLSNALTELRADLVQQAQDNVRAHNANEADANNVKTVVERKTEMYKNEIEELKDQIAEMQRGSKNFTKSEEKLREELKKVLEECERKEQTINRLKLEVRGKESDVTHLQGKVKRIMKSKRGFDEVQTKPEKLVEEESVVPMDAAAQEGSRPPSKQSPNDMNKAIKLQSEISSLKKENKNLTDQLNSKEQDSKKSIEVAKWDAKKQWQGKLEQLKLKLKEKDKQIESLEKQNFSQRETVSRLERDRARRASIGPPIHAQGTGEKNFDPRSHAARQDSHKIEELSRRLYEQEEENKELRRSELLPQKKFAAEMEEQNRILNDKLEALQNDILSSRLTGSDSGVSEHFQARENQLQNRILKLSSDNAQLLFEMEQLKLDLPRLQERLEYQQKYIELLQSEKKETQSRPAKVKFQQPVKQGTSGKSIVELEKTVGLMKKVVERVQRENDQLKRAPGVVSNQELDDLRLENKNLQDRLHEMMQQIGGQLSKRYEAKGESMEKLINENQRLKKELNKTATSRDKLKNAKEVAQTEKDNLAKAMDELKRKLSISESKAPKLAGSGSKGYNSAVTAKMLEVKLQKTEEDLKKQNLQVESLRAVLQRKSADESNLREENKNLSEKIEVLERFPPCAGGADANTVRELQLERLVVARLENEKEELIHELEVLRKSGSVGSREKKIDDVSTGAEILRLETELKVVQEERNRMRAEVGKLRKDLAHFDAAFFDELEDLKYNYSQSTKRNVIYEEQLRSLSKQFGVSVNIPESDSD